MIYIHILHYAQMTMIFERKMYHYNTKFHYNVLILQHIFVKKTNKFNYFFKAIKLLIINTLQLLNKLLFVFEPLWQETIALDDDLREHSEHTRCRCCKAIGLWVQTSRQHVAHPKTLTPTDFEEKQLHFHCSMDIVCDCLSVEKYLNLENSISILIYYFRF